MSGRANLHTTSVGTRDLLLRGSWIPEAQTALESDEWDRLSLFGVDWADYSNLVPHAARIKWLSVPIGPDSSVGLEALTSLEILELRDVPKPPLDFRCFPKLRELECYWQKRNQASLCHPGVRRMTVHSVGGTDLGWMSGTGELRHLQLRGGRPTSLAGLERATRLSSLYIARFNRCVDVSQMIKLTELEAIDIDVPKAEVESTDWIATMPKLKSMSLGASVHAIDWDVLARHPSLTSIIINVRREPSASDAEIVARLGAGGRIVREFQRYVGETPGFRIILE